MTPVADTKYRGTPPASNKLSVQQDCNIATLSHFGGVVGCIPSGIIYYLYRGRGAFTEQESREALNFTFLPTLIICVAILLSAVPYIGWVFGLIASLTWTYLAIMSLVAGIKVNRGNPYQYPGNTMLFDRISNRGK